jgi:hypothetical protein
MIQFQLKDVLLERPKSVQIEPPKPFSFGKKRRTQVPRARITWKISSKALKRKKTYKNLKEEMPSSKSTKTEEPNEKRVQKLHKG